MCIKRQNITNKQEGYYSIIINLEIRGVKLIDRNFKTAIMRIKDKINAKRGE